MHKCGSPIRLMSHHDNTLRVSAGYCQDGKCCPAFLFGMRTYLNNIHVCDGGDFGDSSRREPRSLVVPNKRRATTDGRYFLGAQLVAPALSFATGSRRPPSRKVAARNRACCVARRCIVGYAASSRLAVIAFWPATHYAGIIEIGSSLKFSFPDPSTINNRAHGTSG